MPGRPQILRGTKGRRARETHKISQQGLGTLSARRGKTAGEKMNRRAPFLFFVLLLAAPPLARAYAAAELREALCGAAPRSAAEAEAELKKLKRLEGDMPPVSLQTPASWCYLFPTLDQVHHHIRLAAKKQGRAHEYSDRTMLSPLDAA